MSQIIWNWMIFGKSWLTVENPVQKVINVSKSGKSWQQKSISKYQIKVKLVKVDSKNESNYMKLNDFLVKVDSGKSSLKSYQWE